MTFSDHSLGATASGTYVVVAQNLDAITGFSYDATTNSYTVTYTTVAGGPGYSAPPGSRSLTYTPADVVAGQANFTTYSKNDAADPAQRDTLELFALGRENTAINLTYVSYGIQSVGDGIHFMQRDFFVYGAPTSISTMPVSGTGSWSGIVDGIYNASSVGQTYRLSGTSTLSADFSAGTVNASITFTGANLVPGNPSLASQTFSGPGGIGGLPGYHFTGNMTGGGLPGGGTYWGSFYGDNAKEYGFVFLYGGMTVQFSGVALGK